MLSNLIYFSPLIKGFTIGGSLIVAIGAQNAFILKQGLMKNHVFLTAFVCFFFDSILITLGVLGIGAFINQSPLILNTFRFTGAAFLTWYGIQSLRSAFSKKNISQSFTNPPPNRIQTLLSLCAFTLLNPHAYLDTFVILGGIGAQYPTQTHFSFILGALISSFIWFFGISYGASRLSPWFKSPKTWKVLDTLIGIMMLGISISLLFFNPTL